MRAMRSSKYSPAPTNRKKVRAGRIERVGEGECRLSELGRDGRWNEREKLSRQVNAAKQVIIVSSEMYPERGIFSSLISVRWVADKSSFGNPGNGTAVNQISRRPGDDPPKNESGAI